jgi:methionyl-tRNA formyltransferase
MLSERTYRRPAGGGGWWNGVRKVAAVVDNPSWVLPFVQIIVDRANAAGDLAMLCRTYDDIPTGNDIALFLGCVGIAQPAVLSRSRRNLVVHSSDLPRGRGFAPLAWQILNGQKEITTCLIEAAAEVDAGPIVERDVLRFNGTELYPEWREAQGWLIVDLVLRFLAAADEPHGIPQTGEATKFRRRTRLDSKLDPDKTIAEQFDLLRTVDNDEFPAFFTYRGRTYKLAISLLDPPSHLSDLKSKS